MVCLLIQHHVMSHCWCKYKCEQAPCSDAAERNVHFVPYVVVTHQACMQTHMRWPAETCVDITHSQLNYSHSFECLATSVLSFPVSNSSPPSPSQGEGGKAKNTM